MNIAAKGSFFRRELAQDILTARHLLAQGKVSYAQGNNDQKNWYHGYICARESEIARLRGIARMVLFAGRYA